MFMIHDTVHIEGSADIILPTVNNTVIHYKDIAYENL